jgi:hypothetical protein
LGRSAGFLRSGHLRSSDRFITIFDFDVPGRTGIGHRMPPGVAFARGNKRIKPDP